MNKTTSVLARLNALGDLTRCRLLAVLELDEFSVGELGRVLQLRQPSVSRHLKVLSEQGWVTARPDGTRRRYRLITPLPEGAAELWAVVRSQMASLPSATADLERSHAVVARREDRARAFFSSSAERWDALRVDLYGSNADALPLFGLLDPDWTVADLGTGTGVMAASLAPFVARVVGVDRSPEMLTAAARRTRAFANVDLHEADLTRLPLPDRSVDLAILSLVLHYLPDPGAVLAEARRVLRPGGRLILLDLRRHERPEFRKEMGHLWPGFEDPRLDAWLETAGLDCRPSVPVPPDPAAQGPLLFLRSARRPVESREAPHSHRHQRSTIPS